MFSELSNTWEESDIIDQLLTLSVQTAEEWLTSTSYNQLLYNTDLMLCAHVFIYEVMNA